MFEKLWIISIFTLIIHSIETLSYAVRLAGVRTEKLALSLSLFNMIVIIARLAYTIQAPMTASLVDAAKVNMDLAVLEDQFRIILGFATLGSLLGMLLLPTFVPLFSKVILHFELAGSVPQLIRNVATIRHVQRAKAHVRFPRWEMLLRIRFGGIPKRLLLTNMLITSIYTVGILAALYASLLAPAYQSTAQMSSGFINGLATVLLVLFVDPKVALLTEQVLEGKADRGSIDKMVGVLMISRTAGTLLAQLLLVPAAIVIVHLSKLLA